MSSTRCGISAKQLERELGVTYKTAWRMFKQVRSLMGEESGPLTGIVEVDETYVGGRRRNTPHGRPGLDSHKTPVVGIVQREGRVAALVTKDVKAKTVVPLIEKTVPVKGSTIFTDEFRVYSGLAAKGYTHRDVQHSAKVWVSGDVHTNTIEGFWSLLKRGINGVYHAVDRKYLQSYVDEYTFRYNHRDDEQPMFASLGGRVKKVRSGKYGEYSPVG